MGRPARRKTLVVEVVERRALLSAVGMASRIGTGLFARAREARVGEVTVNNEILNPSGQPTPREQRRQTLRATFSGPYTIGPGRFSSQASQVFIRGAGTSNAFLHGDLLLRIATPNDPEQPPTGALTMFDRNASNGSQLGLELTGSRQDVDRFGRPTRFTFTIDHTVSGGVFTQASGSGTLQIRYLASGRGIGTAQVLARGSVYTLGTTNVLANSDIDP
jgi:hypothetical protein